MHSNWVQTPLAALAGPTLTREVFGNIPGWAKLAFYLLASVCVLIFAAGCYRRMRWWWRGRDSPSSLRPLTLVRNLVHNVHGDNYEFNDNLYNSR